MNVKRLATLGLLVVSLLVIATGCGGRLLARAEPTSPPTRTPRPTFTPLPEVTDTPVPTDTPQQPTEAPTKPPAPTKKVIATAKPQPTQPPAAPVGPTNTPVPPKSSYQYSYIRQTCEHSGGTYVKVIVFSDYHDPDSQQAGVKVRLSWEADGPSIADVLTDAYGEGTFVLAADNTPAKVGTYYAWTINGQGGRTSEMSAPIVINGKNEDAADTCWMAKVYFAAGK